MFIGISTKTLVNELFEEGDISPAEKQKLYLAVHTFHSEMFSYGIQKLPNNDSVSAFVIMSKRDVASFDDVLYFVAKLELNYDLAKLNALSEQFLDYQMLNDHDLPNSVWQNACYYYD